MNNNELEQEKTKLNKTVKNYINKLKLLIF